ncbi:MAG: SCO family protein [Pseudomonadota bacterium]
MTRRLLGLIGLCFAAACGGGDSAEIPADGIIRLSDQFAGGFDLVNADGDRVTSEDYKGKVSVIYFGFASCPDVCPLALGLLSAALADLDDDERARLQPVFITVDPERDTPEAMKVYLSSFHEDIVGLTGSPAAVEAARQGFKVYAQKAALEGSALDYTMNHTSLFYVVDKTGAPVLALRDTLTAEQLAAALRRNI